MPQWLQDFLATDLPWKILGAAVILIGGVLAVAILSRTALAIFGERLGPQGTMVVKKLIRYIGYAFAFILALNQMGLNLGAILGAAGVAGIAVGFAAQTSLSNIISGFFMIGERPFELGDIIEVDGIAGTVDTIGLLALTLRTFDNRSVRIPNETLVKTQLINVTRHPIRRFNLDIGVAYDENIGHVLKVMQEVAETNLQSLNEPDPLIIFTGFGDSSLNFLLGAWCVQEDYGTLRNTLPRELKERFDKENIEIPFPHMTLAAGKALSPIPVDLISDSESTD
ncbi:MAG TPA: mechanosensitive ion channel protein [Verrucomicrobiales bacterium]|nr:mechanosensitive ion channel protein [Roseibacillus sp.]HBM78733.1 mechanosensitive ion channel protein [Verrucomicrobiales bacterium]